MSIHPGDPVPGPVDQGDFAALATWGRSTKLSFTSGLVKGFTEFAVKLLPGQ